MLAEYNAKPTEIRDEREAELKPYGGLEKFEGQVISGILVTESGILAAAHLGGVGSVKKFFRNNGKRYFKDAYGTSIRSYMRDFGGYETSGIVADSRAKVK